MGKKLVSKESEIKADIIEFLRMNGIFCFCVQTTGIFDPVRKIYRPFRGKGNMVGVADVLAILPGSGRFMAIEIKSEKGRLSDHQIKFLKSVNEEGGLGFVARSVTDVCNQINLLHHEQAPYKI